MASTPAPIDRSQPLGCPYWQGEPVERAEIWVELDTGVGYETAWAALAAGRRKARALNLAPMQEHEQKVS